MTQHSLMGRPNTEAPNEQAHQISQHRTFLVRFGGFLSVRWTDKIKALKKHEQQRAPTGDNNYFFAQSGALFIISKL
jgi:hypothetical protein